MVSLLSRDTVDDGCLSKDQLALAEFSLPKQCLVCDQGVIRGHRYLRYDIPNSNNN